MDRRRFLIGVGIGGMSLIPAYFLFKNRPNLFSSHGQSLKALTEHLLPSETQAPGAAEIHAVGYFHWVLEDSKLDRGDRKFLRNGIRNLEHFSYRKTRKRFFELTDDEREKVLRTLEATPEGYRWLKEMLQFLMEALLSDPIYGGNASGMGWKWLHHTPGFPQPPHNKRYFLL